jgi:hypothetical protein
MPATSDLFKRGLRGRVYGRRCSLLAVRGIIETFLNSAGIHRATMPLKRRQGGKAARNQARVLRGEAVGFTSQQGDLYRRSEVAE